MATTSPSPLPFSIITDINTEPARSSLLSVSILHRHGSRGPGKSELDRLAADNPARTEWDAGDMENITQFGHNLVRSLGRWFGTFTQAQFGGSVSPDDAFWRCSGASRAAESGHDFVAGMNEQLGQELLVSPVPFQDGLAPDLFFRPWKIIADRVDTVKDKLLESEEYLRKVDAERAFLEEVSAAAGLKDAKKPEKALWAMTHLLNLLDCEDYWLPAIESSLPHGPLKLRHVLMQRTEITEGCARLKHIEKLACWVWDRRFLKTLPDLSKDLGGRLAIDIYEQTAAPGRKVSVFSGHDYTLMSVMAALGLSDSLSTSMGFGSFLLFELWDGPPPEFDPLFYLQPAAVQPPTAATTSARDRDRDDDLYQNEALSPGSQFAAKNASPRAARLAASSQATLRVVLNPRPVDPPRSFDLGPRTDAGFLRDDEGRIQLDTTEYQRMREFPAVNFSSAQVLAVLAADEFSDRIRRLRSHFAADDSLATAAQAGNLLANVLSTDD